MTLPWFLNPWAEVRRLQREVFKIGLINQGISSHNEALENQHKILIDVRKTCLLLSDENADLKQQIAEMEKDPEKTEDLCGCQTCTDKRPGFRGWDQPGWRYACEKCGNKRCPHHDWHGFKCTGSNEPDQIGEEE